MKVRTIDVIAKEWFDKVNGNSYFSGQITLNYGMENAKTLNMPFQYGYGNQYEYEALILLQKNGILGFDECADYCRAFMRFEQLWQVRDKLGIILRTSKQENCKKRDVVIFGME